MKNKILLLTVSFTALLAANLNAITITNFGGASAVNSTFSGGDWSGGAVGSTLFENFTPVDLSSATNITFSGTANSVVPAAMTFQFTLTENNTAGQQVAQFTLTGADMNNGGSSTLFTPGAGAASVGGVFIQTGGGPTDSFDINMGSLSATIVPEPSAFALLVGCFGLAWVMVRRRA